ncbi:MAG: hypothetical protein HZA46_24780 [Planctomycetales bacterium]|nr:hypothetical protein [Planctomycetales bacterium]
MIRFTARKTGWLAAGLTAISLCATPGCMPMWGQTQGQIPWWRTNAIPDRYPLGSVVREPFHAMQTNAEAADFILHRCDFIAETAELSQTGRERVLEIAARMRSAPFPVLVEPSQHNFKTKIGEIKWNVQSSGERNAETEQREIEEEFQRLLGENRQLEAEHRLLDTERRNTIAAVLSDLGNPDADQRTFVGHAYGRGITSMEGETDYYRFIYSRGGNGNNNQGNNGFNGGFSGGGGGFF